MNELEQPEDEQERCEYCGCTPEEGACFFCKDGLMVD